MNIGEHLYRVTKMYMDGNGNRENVHRGIWKWMDEWMNEWIDGWMDRDNFICSDIQSLGDCHAPLPWRKWKHVCEVLWKEVPSTAPIRH